VLGSAAHAQTFNGSGFGAIPDGTAPTPPAYGAPLDISFNVSGLSGTFAITSVSFSANHSFVGDLKVSLIAPNGTSHVLFERTGATTATSLGSSSNLVAANNYSFADTRTSNWWTAAVIGDLNIPSTNARSVISGGEGVSNPPPVTTINASFAVVPNGTWRLRFEDGSQGAVGNVTAASLVLRPARTVTKIADTSDGACDSDCSLREALTAAQNGDLINFSSLFDTPQFIDLTTALPVITRSISIQGPGAQLLTVRRAFTAASEFRVFDIPGGVTNGVAISGMTISNGRTTNFGGGILSRSPLTLSGVHITGNTATLGGGVFLGDTGGVIAASTLSGNVSTGDGGGLFFEGNNGDVLVVANSTISGNYSAGNSGGIRTTRGQLQLTNSTVVANTAVFAPGGIIAVAQTAGNTSNIVLRSTIVTGNAPDNFAAVSVGGTASIQTNGFNLSDNFGTVFTPLTSDITTTTPRLAPLALYGGTTPTHALLHGSQAINAGDASSQSTDQRRLARVFGPSADIGAVEMRARVVTNINDSGAGSLRDAILASNTAGDLDDIVFDGSVFNTPRTITLTSGELPISNPLTVIAPGANLLTISGNYASRVFVVTSATPATLSGLTITAGVGNDGAGIRTEGRLSVSDAAIIGNTAERFGGGIYGTFGAQTTLERSSISGNTSNANFRGTGGGIDHNGTLTVSDSTISGNSAPNGNSNAGGAWILGSAHIVNSTITSNSTAGSGSASGVIVFNFGVTLRNSIIAGNRDNATLPDVRINNSSLNSHGFNLIGNPGALAFNQTGDQVGNSATPLNPRLAPLALYGGTTPTHALLHGSPALNAGNVPGALSDQRGIARAFGLNADIGAVEMRPRVVTNANNSGGGRLRDAIAASNATNDLDDILFDSAFFSTPRTITLTTGQLVIASPLNVIAPGANVLTVSGNNASRVFQMNSTANASLSGLTITAGNVGSDSGGGIFSLGRVSISHTAIIGNTADTGGGMAASDGAITTIERSTISGNTANTNIGTGGGIDHNGTLNVTDSTISGNRTPNGDSHGGGMWTRGTVHIINSTIANNSTVGATSASGVFVFDGNLTLRNSIVAGNSNNATSPDVRGAGIVSRGFNLIGNRGAVGFTATGDQSGTGATPLNPLLAALANNGGTTQTHALLPGSPALDKGERSVQTPINAACDGRWISRRLPILLMALTSVRWRRRVKRSLTLSCAMALNKERRASAQGWDAHASPDQKTWPHSPPVTPPSLNRLGDCRIV
jgi:CSLREA domain-containing protein